MLKLIFTVASCSQDPCVVLHCVSLSRYLWTRLCLCAAAERAADGSRGNQDGRGLCEDGEGKTGTVSVVLTQHSELGLIRADVCVSAECRSDSRCAAGAAA